jgi:uncharacterized membrane protein
MAADVGSARLDTFVDAAFAFALTLLVAGSVEAGSGRVVGDLRATVANLPAFAFGFAVLAMFWHEHVTWRRLADNNRAGGLLLSLALVFVIVLFVIALGPMAAAVVGYATMGVSPGVSGQDLPFLFRLYGAGFATMCSLVMLLYRQGMGGAAAPARRQLRGRAIIYALLATTGLASIALSFVPRLAPFAGFAYATIPLLVGLFAWRYRWEER